MRDEPDIYPAISPHNFHKTLYITGFTSHIQEDIKEDMITPRFNFVDLIIYTGRIKYTILPVRFL
jgi:hypothetical protein